MAHVVRYRKWDAQVLATPAILSGIVIEVSDLLYQSVDGNVYPASNQPDQGSENANQELFACRFLGVALEGSIAGDVVPITVGTSGEYEFIVAALAAALVMGTRFAASENAGGTALLDQTIEAAGNDNETIARLTRPAAAGARSVFVKIFSEIIDGGVGGEDCDSSSSTPV